VKTRNGELAKDIEIQVLEKIHVLPYFNIQCDAATDVSQLLKLLVYVHFIGSSSTEEEILFCTSLETNTTLT